MTNTPIEITFLRDLDNGGPQGQPLRVAQQWASFISSARRSIHIAVYDFHFRDTGSLFPIVVNALIERAKAGVEVCVAYDAGKIESGGLAGADPSPNPLSTPGFLNRTFSGTGIQIRAITDKNAGRFDPRLMHDKYMVIDGGTDQAAVWTGSANFTDDTWTFQENNIVQIASRELAHYYEVDFSELWASQDIDSTGSHDYGTVAVDNVQIDVAFSPGEGKRIDQHVADLIGGAAKRIKVCSMLISSHEILYALQRAIRGKQVAELGGIHDKTQMQETLRNWQSVPKNIPMIPIFEEVAARLAGKVSIPWSPGTKHNFMHNKVLVCDDAVLLGSYNLSHSATMNAENALIIHSASVADQYCAYIDQLVTTYQGADTK